MKLRLVTLLTSLPNSAFIVLGTLPILGADFSPFIDGLERSTRRLDTPPERASQIVDNSVAAADRQPVNIGSLTPKLALQRGYLRDRKPIVPNPERKSSKPV